MLRFTCTEKFLILLSDLLIRALNSCGFKLTKCVGSSEYILKSVATSELFPKYVSVDLNEKPIERVLGMIWDLNDKTFVFRPISVFFLTKHGISSLISTTFDPLGFLTQVCRRQS